MTTKQTVTQELIDDILNSAETQEATFWNKELVVSYKLYNGFTIVGRSACVDPDYFDVELGRKYAREDASNQLWKLEAYLLQNNLYKLSINKTTEDWLAIFESYEFVDKQGHKLTKCQDLINLIELVKST